MLDFSYDFLYLYIDEHMEFFFLLVNVVNYIIIFRRKEGINYIDTYNNSNESQSHCDE